MLFFDNRPSGLSLQAVPRIKSKSFNEILAPQLLSLPPTQVSVVAEFADLAARCVEMQVGTLIIFVNFIFIFIFIFIIKIPRPSFSLPFVIRNSANFTNITVCMVDGEWHPN